MSNQKPETRNQKKGQSKIFVVSGPSGSGKTTLVAKAARAKGLRNRLIKSVSFTTRRKRPGEKNGRDYFFISRQQFAQRRKEQKLLEWTKYSGYYYATPGDFVERWLNKSRNIVLCLDLKGARRIKQIYPARTVTIFIAPPTLGALRGRIEGRCRTGKKELKERLRLAGRELGNSRRYDYAVVNNNFAQALKKLQEIISKETGVKAR